MQVLQRFHLTCDEDQDLFSSVPEAPVRPELAAMLQWYVPMAPAISTEKARSEWIVAPLLAELFLMTDGQVSLFSGTEFSPDAASGLAGAVDFLISRSRERYFTQVPGVAVMEAKNEDTRRGLGQCAAIMVAAQRFNERGEQQSGVVFGGVTTGSNWRFLQLDGAHVAVDRREYHFNQLGLILGILQHMVSTGGPGRDPAA